MRVNNILPIWLYLAGDTLKKKKATINLDDYFYDPSPKDEYSEMDDEVFEGMYLSGIKPADLPNVKDQEEYAAWIKAHPNGLDD